MKTLHITAKIPLNDDEFERADQMALGKTFKQTMAATVDQHFGEGHKVEVSHEIVGEKPARKPRAVKAPVPDPARNAADSVKPASAKKAS